MSTGGRPREDHVATKEAACRRHGIVEKRGYDIKRTKADGTPVVYTKWFCPDCERERAAASRANRAA